MDYNSVYIQQYKFIYKQQTWFMYKNITLFTNNKQIIYILRHKILTEIFFQNQSIHWECFGLTFKCLQSKGTWTYFLRNNKGT